MKKLLISLTLMTGLASCHQSGPVATQNQTPRTKITVTHVGTGSIGQQIELMAETDYLNTIQVTAPISGFIHQLNIKPNDAVRRGQQLFTVVSSEQQALGGQVTPIPVHASMAAVVSSVNTQTANYVTEGTPVCTLTDLSSFVFKVKVPSEYSRQIHQGTHCTIVEADGTRLPATLRAPMMTMDGTDQTIDYVVTVKSRPLPAGLVAKATVEIGSRSDKVHQTLPVEAVQSDDNMTSYWVMRLRTDSTVEKIPVTVGNRDSRHIEIISPRLSPSDRIVLSGAYGLAQDALVNIQ